MAHIIVLAGGTSDERAVSLRSGAAVQAALVAAGHDSFLLDYTPQGISDAQLLAADAVFPALHGPGGEDGEVQQRLERLGLCYVGAGVTASALCMDKQAYRQHVDGQLPIPGGEIVTSTSFATSPLRDRPFVLKPISGGSSLDTFIIRQPATTDYQPLEAALERYGSMLLEELIEGTEVTVAVLGEEALPVVEIIPPAGQEFDYAHKYDGSTRELCPPQHITPEVQAAARQLAEQTHQLCGCRDLSRSDMIVQADGSLRLLETNTMPGLTEQSLLPKAAAATGLPMAELCGRLVAMALARH